MMPTTNTNQYQRILTAHERAMHRRQADKDRIGRLLGPQDQYANTTEITTQRLASAKLDVDMPLKSILRILSTFNPKGNTLKVKIPIRTMLISFTLTKAIFEDGIPLIKTEKENYKIHQWEIRITISPRSWMAMQRKLLVLTSCLKCSISR